MMLRPGDSVRVNLPNRSIVQSKPCGTVFTPATSVKTISSAAAMAKISKPDMRSPCGGLRAMRGASDFVAAGDFRVRYLEKRGAARTCAPLSGYCEKLFQPSSPACACRQPDG